VSVTQDVYDFLNEQIDASLPGDALFEAVAARNARTSVEEAEKVVRIYGGTQRFGKTNEASLKDRHVEITLQFIVRPASDSLDDLDAAIDTSLEMARQFFEAATDDPTLGSRGCDANFYDDDGKNNVEFGEASIGSTLYGTTYLDGLINHAS
jgi:hypothetical protein